MHVHRPITPQQPPTSPLPHFIIIPTNLDDTTSCTTTIYISHLLLACGWHGEEIDQHLISPLPPPPRRVSAPPFYPTPPHTSFPLQPTHTQWLPPFFTHTPMEHRSTPQDPPPFTTTTTTYCNIQAAFSRSPAVLCSQKCTCSHCAHPNQKRYTDVSRQYIQVDCSRVHPHKLRICRG